MNKLILTFYFFITLALLFANDLKEIIPISPLEPKNIDARKFYDENDFTHLEEEIYKRLKLHYFSNIEKINDQDECINILSGEWVINKYSDALFTDYKDFKGEYYKIGFLNDSYYGFAVNFWGDGTFPLYKNQDYLVSTVGTMGWIGPILRYEFQNEKMYLYILNMDKWELADFHEGGKNYFIKTSPTHTPLTP
jgi:hypothetical protein